MSVKSKAGASYAEQGDDKPSAVGVSVHHHIHFTLFLQLPLSAPVECLHSLKASITLDYSRTQENKFTLNPF